MARPAGAVIPARLIGHRAGDGAARTTWTIAARSRPSREAHHRSVLPAKPRPAENSSAVFPLDRHSATRRDHVSELVMHARVALRAPLARTVLVHRIREGAHRACVLLGIVATCRAVGVPVQAYLAWAFERDRSATPG
jgi:hypothetical protein